jgi:hypothetical protein
MGAHRLGFLVLIALLSFVSTTSAGRRTSARITSNSAMIKALTGDPQEVRKRAMAMQWSMAMAQKAAVLNVCGSKSVAEARREVEDFLSANLPGAMASSLATFDQTSANMARVPQRIIAPAQCGSLERLPAVQRSIQAEIDSAARLKNALMQQLGMSDDRCSPIAQLTARLGQEYPDLDFMNTPMGNVYPKVISLFADPSFTALFGKPYDAMTKQERSAIARDRIQFCLNSPQFKNRFTWEHVVLPRPFLLETGDFSHAEVAQAVVANRHARQTLPKAIAALKELPPAPDSYDRAMAMAEKGNHDFAGLWPSEFRAFTEAVGQARHRLAPALLASRLDRAIGAADDYAGAVTLKNVLAANQELLEQVDPALRQSQTARVQNKLHTLLENLLASERASVDALGADLPSLAAGKQWHQDFNTHYAAVFSDPAVNDLLIRFADSRRRTLAAMNAELMALIGKADSPGAVQSITDRYLDLSIDRSVAAGQAVLSAAEARREKLLVATAALENQYGSPAEPDIVDTADSPGDSKRPTAHEMYEAVKAQVAAINGSLQSTAKACLGGGYRNDPLLAMQCLSLCGGSGGTCKVGVTLTRFERLGCAPAAGKAGFMCDYIVGFSTHGTTVPASLAQILGGGQLTQARFLPRGKAWIIIAEPARY